MPGWDLLLKFMERDPQLMASIKSFYPRMMPHRDIKEVSLLPYPRAT
jgi:cystathionine gamma-synthase